MSGGVFQTVRLLAAPALPVGALPAGVRAVAGLPPPAAEGPSAGTGARQPGGGAGGELFEDAPVFLADGEEARELGLEVVALIARCHR